MTQAFKTSEYRTRVDNLRVLMTARGLDALLVINETDISYLTGYIGWSSYVPQGALIKLNEDPYLLLREVDLTNTVGTVWLPEDRIIGYSEGNIGAGRSAWSWIGNFVDDKLASTDHLGAEPSFEGWWKGLGVTDHVELLAGLSGRDLRDGKGLLTQLRKVKSDAELAHMIDAAAIADEAMLAGFDKIAVGVRQADVAAVVMSKLISGTSKVPGGPLNFTPWMHVGKPGGFANGAHLRWTDDVYEENQQTNMEFGAYRHRYVAALARTAYLGTPSTRLLEISDAVIEGWHSGFGAMKPGATCSDVATAVGRVLARAGISKNSRCGYSIGIDWVDGAASLATHDHTELEPNMTFHLLVGVWNPHEGYNFSETVRVTADGAKSLSSTVPRKLFEIPA